MSHARTSGGPHASHLLEALGSSRRSLWLGALSFEERCAGSLAWLRDNNLRLWQGIVLDYPTKVHPAAVADKRREHNWEKFIDYGNNVFQNEIRSVTIEPYAFQDLQDLFDSAVVRQELDLVIFDITCITKIHALALAAALNHREITFKWIIAYSTPENYGALMGTPRRHRKGPGWRDIIVAPLNDTASLFNESHSRGIIMTGHEADRLIVGLAELEPSGGLIINTDTPGRPDLRFMSQRLNSKIIRQLTRMRASNWDTRVIDVANFKDLKTHITREVSIARKYRAPVILFPYGPKSLLFAAAIQISSGYPESSWFVYPVPTSYDVNYTEGIENTIWLWEKDDNIISLKTRHQSALVQSFV